MSTPSSFAPAEETSAANDLPARVDYLVVGAGIVGLAVARELLLRRPGSTLCVLEKEGSIGLHQTGHNSGVVHAGLYYKPGSAKAELCRRGVSLLRDYCSEKGIAYDECGKLVVARNDDEDAKLPGMLERASALGVPGLHIVDARGIQDLEPHVVGKSALVSPTTAIVDYFAVTRGYASDVGASGGRILLATRVEQMTPSASGTRVTTSRGQIRARQVIICAGLQTDRLDRAVGGDRDPQIMPFRGEYFVIRPGRESLVRALVYPVPDPRYPFLGVHFTKRVSGAVDVGPNAVLALAREGYRWRQVSIGDVAEMARYAGAWRLARSNMRAGITEMLGSLSKRVYVRRARDYVPELRTADLLPAPAGVRAQAVGQDGSLIDDFVFRQHEGILAVRNAPSPAATASLAIAERIVRQVLPTGTPRDAA